MRFYVSKSFQVLTKTMNNQIKVTANRSQPATEEM